MEILSPSAPDGYGSAVRNFLPSLLLLAASTAFSADWIELKDGTRVEGEISSVTTNEIVIEVQRTPTIREETSYPRADVANFQRATPDDLSFAEIAGLQPPATADDPAVYTVLLDQKVRPFMEKFPYSKHLPAARKLSAQFEAEQARIKAGEVKIDGTWITVEEMQADRPEISARLILAKMKAAPDPAAALALFDSLEKTRATSSAYPAAAKLARTKIDELRVAVAKARTDLARREAEQAEGLKLASADRRALLQTGIDQEKAAIEAQVARAKQAGSKWPPLVPETKTLDELEKLASSEGTRLAALNVESMEQALAALERTDADLAAGNIASAKENLATAQKLWSQSARIAALQEKLKLAEQAAAAAPTPATP